MEGESHRLSWLQTQRKPRVQAETGWWQISERDKVNLKIWGQEAPNDLLKCQVPAIGNQRAIELGEKVLDSGDSGQVAKPALGWGVGAAHCLGALALCDLSLEPIK